MSAANPSILSHVSIGTNQFDQAVAFYDQVLATLGCKRILAHPGAVAWGREYPEFWVQQPINGQPASIGNGSHFGFVAPDKASVQAFYAAALEAEPAPMAHRGRVRIMASPTTAASSATSTDTRSRRPIGTWRRSTSCIPNRTTTEPHVLGHLAHTGAVCWFGGKAQVPELAAGARLQSGQAR